MTPQGRAPGVRRVALSDSKSGTNGVRMRPGPWGGSHRALHGTRRQSAALCVPRANAQPTGCTAQIRSGPAGPTRCDRSSRRAAYAIFFRQENLGAQCSNGARLSMTLSWLVSIPERDRDDTKIPKIVKVSNNRIKEEARAVYSPAGAVAPVCHLALCHLTTATPAKMISIAVTSRSPNGSRKNNQPMAIATTAFIYG